MASIHAEVPNDVDIETSHEVIDRIERDAVGKLGIFLVIHMDPVETKDEHTLAVKTQVAETLKEMDEAASIHDFRLVGGKEQVNLIFDMMLPYHYNKEQEQTLCRELTERLQKLDKRYHPVITVEKSYVAAGKEE